MTIGMLLEMAEVGGCASDVRPLGPVRSGILCAGCGCVWTGGVVGQLVRLVPPIVSVAMGGYVSTGNAVVDQNFETTNDRLVQLESEVLRLKAQVEVLEKSAATITKPRTYAYVTGTPSTPLNAGALKPAVMPRGWNVPGELKHLTQPSATAGRAPSSLDV